MKNILRVALPPIFTAIALLLVWEIAVVVFKPAAYLLPSPLAILRAANIDSRQLINATLSTAISAGLGFVIAAVVGMVCASVLSQSQFLQRGLYPLASLFQMVPLVAIAPLLVIWFGYGLSATVASAAIVIDVPKDAAHRTSMEFVALCGRVYEQMTLQTEEVAGQTP